MTTSLDLPAIEVLPEVRKFVDGPLKLFVGGQFVDSASGRTFATEDPATGGKIADVAEGDAEDVDRAVKAARAALEGPWAKIRPTDRGRLLERLAVLIEDHADELAADREPRLRQAGRPHPRGRHRPYLRAPALLRGLADQDRGRDAPDRLRRRARLHAQEPVGVVGAIVPWNFPLCQAVFKIAPALAAGCTVVLKPAEQTPLTAIAPRRAGHRGRLPDGVLNVVSGYGETAGAALVDHPGVDKIAFTGSVAVGAS